MARYIGPKSRIARRFGEPIFGADKVLSCGDDHCHAAQEGSCA